MNYTRKRALLACDFCRHRKRRCDGEKPCSTCRESNASCKYKDLPVERLEPSPASSEPIQDQLDRIESLLKSLVVNASGEAAGIGTHVSYSPQAAAAAAAEATAATTLADALEPGITFPLTHTRTQTQTHAHTDTPTSSLSYATSTTPVASLSLSPVSADALLDFQHLAYSSSQFTPDISYPGTTSSMSLGQDYPLLPYLDSGAGVATNTTTATTTAGDTASAQTPVIPTPSELGLADFLPHCAFSPVPVYPHGYSLPPAAPDHHHHHHHHSLVTSSPSGTPPDVSSPPFLDLFPQQQQIPQPPQQQQQQQPLVQFAFPRESSTAASSLLAMPEVHFLLAHQRDRSHSSKPAAAAAAAAARTSAFSAANAPRWPFPVSRTLFYDIEARRPLHDDLHPIYSYNSPGLRHAAWPLPITDPARTDKISSYVAAYFAHVYPSTPLINIEQYAELSEGMFDAGDGDGNGHGDGDRSIQKAICLIIWALGALVAEEKKEHDHDALLYFQPAFKIIQHHAVWEFGPASLAVCQALLLAASYFAHIGRPLHNARMVYLAGGHLLRLYRQRKGGGLDAERQRDFCTAFWVCFLWESDRASEFDIPLSGIAKLVDRIPPLKPAETDNQETMIYLTAEIAARKIANQARDCLYGPPLPTEYDVSEGVVMDTQPHKRRRDESEGAVPSSRASGTTATANNIMRDSTQLNHQLDLWYKTIPAEVRPRLGRRGEGEDEGYVIYGDASTATRKSLAAAAPALTEPLPERAQVLCAQYYAVRHAIHRPFVLSVAWQQQQSIRARERRRKNLAKKGRLANSEPLQPPLQPPLPLATLEKCAICVDSCIMFLIHVQPLLEHRSPYLWSLCQTSLACLVVLLVVQACPPMMATPTMRHSRNLRATTVNIARLRDHVAKRVSRWATEGSSLQAQLQILQSLPIPAAASTLLVIPAAPAETASAEYQQQPPRLSGAVK